MSHAEGPITPSKTRSRAPASTDVAREAGVSQKTVSRVMNNEPMVSDAVRARVLKAASELGYRPNSAARALAAGRSFRIGFVSLGTTLHGPVTTLIAAEKAARSRGYSMTITTTPASDPAGVRAAINSALEAGVEGIVLSEPIDGGEVAIDLDVPVLIFGYFPGLTSPHVISTMIAGDQSAEMATSHLLAAGHPTVHHVAGPESWYAARERKVGWLRALEASGAPVNEPFEGDWTAASGYRAGLDLASDSDVSAIFCANDDMALGVLRGLGDAGRRVPQDIAVMGFDDVPVAAYSNPSLSTIRNPFETGSSAGIDALIQAIENPENPTPRLVEPSGELVLRESTRSSAGGGTTVGGGRRP